jgi:hypothetical protein
MSLVGLLCIVYLLAPHLLGGLVRRALPCGPAIVVE